MRTQWTFSVVALCALVIAAGNRPASPPIFNSNPAGLWNGVYASLLLRPLEGATEYGVDNLDPPLWPGTQFPLTGDSHRHALAVLDAFLGSDVPHEIQDPVKRAILQRDLWSVFDWAAAGDNFPRERLELEQRLAQAIHRLALTNAQIRALPDTYATAVASRNFPALPPDIFSPNASFVAISAFGDEPTAISHFTGRSRFLVFMRLPAGRAATENYIDTLRAWPTPPLINSDSGISLLNLSLPQFPSGTEVALLRQAIVLNSEGKLVPTSLTESVQLRVYRKITPGRQYMNYIGGPSSHDQDFYEFRMHRPLLFARRNGGLSAVHPEDLEYATFSTHGLDPFEARHGDPQGPILDRCRACHADSGIQSVQSRLQWVNKPVSNDKREPIAWETDATIARKQQERNFHLLQKLW